MATLGVNGGRGTKSMTSFLWLLVLTCFMSLTFQDTIKEWRLDQWKSDLASSPEYSYYHEVQRTVTLHDSRTERDQQIFDSLSRTDLIEIISPLAWVDSDGSLQYTCDGIGLFAYILRADQLSRLEELCQEIGELGELYELQFNDGNTKQMIDSRLKTELQHRLTTEGNASGSTKSYGYGTLYETSDTTALAKHNGEQIQPDCPIEHSFLLLPSMHTHPVLSRSTA